MIMSHLSRSYKYDPRFEKLLKNCQLGGKKIVFFENHIMIILPFFISSYWACIFKIINLKKIFLIFFHLRLHQNFLLHPNIHNHHRLLHRHHVQYPNNLFGQNHCHLQDKILQQFSSP